MPSVQQPTEEHQKSMETHQKATHFFEHAVQNHRAAVEHLKKGYHEKAAHHGYPAYGLAAHNKEAVLHHSHEFINKKLLHAYEPGRQLI